MIDSGDGPPKPPRRKRTGGIKRSERTPNNSLIDPKTGDYKVTGETTLARRARLEREKSLAEAEWLARHLQLDSRGRVPERWMGDGSRERTNRGPQARKKKIDHLTNYPRIPDGELERLEGILKTYGLPLAALSSDTAAFVVRRVMVDFYRLASLRRHTRKGLFTPEEFKALLLHLEMNPKQFAEFIGADNANAARNSVYRWVHGISVPTGLLAIKVNRMIEQQIRRKHVGGFPEKTRGVTRSENPVTVERRKRKRRVREAQEGAMVIPLARSAQEREDADASARPDGAAEDRGE